jgi:hypothetical protein
MILARGAETSSGMVRPPAFFGAASSPASFVAALLPAFFWAALSDILAEVIEV